MGRKAQSYHMLQRFWVYPGLEMADEVVALQQREYGSISSLKSVAEVGREIANEAISATEIAS